MSIPIPLKHSYFSTRNSLGVATLITLVSVLGILGIYYQTFWSMATIWYRSETYAHGFLILPFTAYMIWSKRHDLATLHHQPNPLALLAFCVLGFLWLVAELASVQVLAQYILIAMIPVIVCAILGTRILGAIIFPLAYLFFAVPFGDILIPPLIDFTADFTVSALQLSGIPVYREGTFFSIPSGNWSVVEACSGLRYLIASVTLGTLYAYLTYRSLKRRFVFIVLAIIVPIIANGIRAYLIVMTGHLSDMKLAVGVDHLIYGWIFFGLVMLLLFWIGSLWREDNSGEKKKEVRSQHKIINNTDGAASLKATTLMAIVVLISALIWPSYAGYLESKATQGINPVIKIDNTTNEWVTSSDSVSDWEPLYIGEPVKFQQSYQNADQDITLYIAYYYNQQQGKELINSGNVLVSESHQHWRNVDKSRHLINLESREISITQNLLYSNSNKLLVWRWYWLGNAETTNPYLAKALLAKNKLLGYGDRGAEIIIASPYEVKPDEAIPVIRQFLADMMPAIVKGLRDAEHY